jgi:hypothetical protein
MANNPNNHIGKSNRTILNKAATYNGVTGLALYRDHVPGKPTTSDTIGFAPGAHVKKTGVHYQIKTVPASSVKLSANGMGASGMSTVYKEYGIK